MKQPAATPTRNTGGAPCLLDRRWVIRSALAFVIASASATAQLADELLGIALEGCPTRSRPAGASSTWTARPSARPA